MGCKLIESLLSIRAIADHFRPSSKTTLISWLKICVFRWDGKQSTRIPSVSLTVRPISSAKGEIAGTLYRARHLIKIARDALKPIPQTDSDTEAVKKTIVKQPIGVVG
jgi:hypothetical protein